MKPVAGTLVMSNVMTWVSIVIAMMFAAGIWFAYLVRVVLNDEVVQERKRRRMRQRELARRKDEDREAKLRRRERR